ncbi:restriction endonuclease subunit S [Treponema putidum]|uniref:restriction endonuclease subunit S n=1 Tax=Treponema putidum TaxID=221027 RepID=UPI0021046862|nr:restriction endonuclease subunit S [Treponema putidum]
MWASLSEIANIYTGNSINENEKNKKYSNVSDGLFYIATKDIDFEGVINYENGIKIPFSESKFKIAPAQSSLICIEGGSAGRKIGFINKEVCFVNKLCCLHCEFIDNLYLFYYLRSSTFIDFFNVNKSGLIGGVSLNLLKRIPLPLPPLSEQQRIVAEIEAIFAHIDLLETNKADLQTAIKQAKSKILDLAIRGKLVPQDPADEPASVMLERLRAEKEAKIAAGEMKRDKNDSYIYKNSTDNCYYEKFGGKNDICIDNEIPFELPENWQWTKLGRICDKLVDGDHNPPKGIEEKTEYIMISSRNINHNTVEDLENVRYLTKEMFEVENLRTNAAAGDILFTSVGSLGRSCIYDGSMNICFQRSVSILNTKVYNKYVKFFFDSNFYQNYVAEHATGTAQMGFYLQEMAESFIAIPPISEQKRIVAKIEEIFNALDDIQRNLV